MITGSLKQRIAAPRNWVRAMFYMRLLIIFAILGIVAFWLDYWLRGELGMAKKIVMFAQGEWGRGVLIAGGIIYSSVRISSSVWAAHVSVTSDKMDFNPIIPIRSPPTLIRVTSSEDMILFPVKFRTDGCHSNQAKK